MTARRGDPNSGGSRGNQAAAAAPWNQQDPYDSQSITPTRAWFQPGQALAREVITIMTPFYLGNNALCKPGEDQGQSGYWITASRPFTPAQLQDLKQDSSLFWKDPRAFKRRLQHPGSQEEADRFNAGKRELKDQQEYERRGNTPLPSEVYPYSQGGLYAQGGQHPQGGGHMYPPSGPGNSGYQSTQGFQDHGNVPYQNEPSERTRFQGQAYGANFPEYPQSKHSQDPRYGYHPESQGFNPEPWRSAPGGFENTYDVYDQSAPASGSRKMKGKDSTYNPYEPMYGTQMEVDNGSGVGSGKSKSKGSSGSAVTQSSLNEAYGSNPNSSYYSSTAIQQQQQQQQPQQQPAYDQSTAFLNNLSAAQLGGDYTAQDHSSFGTASSTTVKNKTSKKSGGRSDYCPNCAKPNSQCVCFVGASGTR